MNKFIKANNPEEDALKLWEYLTTSAPEGTVQLITRHMAMSLENREYYEQFVAELVDLCGK